MSKTRKKEVNDTHENKPKPILKLNDSRGSIQKVSEIAEVRSPSTVHRGEEQGQSKMLNYKE